MLCRHKRSGNSIVPLLRYCLCCKRTYSKRAVVSAQVLFLPKSVESARRIFRAEGEMGEGEITKCFSVKVCVKRYCGRDEKALLGCL